MRLQNIFKIKLFMLLLILSVPIYAALFGKQLCKQEGFTCLKVKGNESWRSLFPDVHDRGVVMRVNRMNTYLYSGITIAIPDHLDVADIMDFSPFPLTVSAPGEKILIFDPIQLAWGAYDADGNLLRWGPASGGADYCKDIDAQCRTHSGTFRIYSLGSSDCYSRKYPLPDGGAPMPYCMYFENGQAFHGEPNGLPGFNASHGCVRMYVNDAEWLRYDFIEGPNSGNRFRGTRVVVKPYVSVDI